MNLKKRLIFSNTLTLVIPFAITALAAFIFFFISSKLLNPDVSYRNFKQLGEIKMQLFEVSSSVPLENPETYESKDYHEYLCKELSDINGAVIVLKDSSVIFSSEDFTPIDIENIVNISKSQSPKKTVSINKTSYLIDSASVIYNDSSSGNILLLAPIGKEFHAFGFLFLIIILVFIITFIIVNIITSYTFSKSILTPVAQLKDAATEIKNGNLDKEIIQSGDEEFIELCHSFETMRIQLKDSIRMKMKYDENRTALVSSISHDLKTPLTSIKGYVEGILDGVANSPEKLERYLKTIYSKAENMDVMIDDLLLYSKLDLNQLPFNFEKTNLLEYFNFYVTESEPELLKSNITIEFKNLLTHSKYTMLDRERMGRVINNIIDNSRKYMDKSHGKIVVTLRETHSSIIIEINDNGSGISKDDLNKIFDRFYRSDCSRSGTKGSGLGLAIAKQIVSGHKGKIWAVSNENEGASIIISLSKIILENDLR